MHGEAQLAVGAHLRRRRGLRLRRRERDLLRLRRRRAGLRLLRRRLRLRLRRDFFLCFLRLRRSRLPLRAASTPSALPAPSAGGGAAGDAAASAITAPGAGNAH